MRQAIQDPLSENYAIQSPLTIERDT